MLPISRDKRGVGDGPGTEEHGLTTWTSGLRILEQPQGPLLSQGFVLCPPAPPTFRQTLDAFAAMACTEMLTRDILKPSPQAWLQMVKSLSMPLELLCSDGYLQTCGEMARDVIREVR